MAYRADPWLFCSAQVRRAPSVRPLASRPVLHDSLPVPLLLILEPSCSVEEAQDLAAELLPTGLLMIHNAMGRCHHNDAELTGW